MFNMILSYCDQFNLSSGFLDIVLKLNYHTMHHTMIITATNNIMAVVGISKSDQRA